MINRLEGSANVPDERISVYADPTTPEYGKMIEEIRKDLNFTSLRYHRLDDLLESVGIPKEKLCTYCWNGRE